MKKQLIKKIILVFSMTFIFYSDAMSAIRYGEFLCHDSNYFCLEVRRGDTWENLFPNLESRDLVRRLNRMNIPLEKGMKIAIPKKLDKLSIYDISPFPRTIPSIGEKVIYVSPQKLAFGAYDEEGELVWWGPISPGIGNCKSYGGCRTPTGAYRIAGKQDVECISTAFPRRMYGENGGALMPYCMHFFLGYALHGSATVPGYAASHGCIRLFVEDAQWLNEEFVEVSSDEIKGTRVIIDPSI